jgi:hypothetical protein
MNGCYIELVFMVFINQRNHITSLGEYHLVDFFPEIQSHQTRWCRPKRDVVERWFMYKP